MSDILKIITLLENEKGEVITTSTTETAVKDFRKLPLSEYEKDLKDISLKGAGDFLEKILSEADVDEPAPSCPSCGAPMKRIGRRKKKLVTLIGDTYFERNYYGCQGCKTYMFPKDALHGVTDTSFTPEVRDAVAETAAYDTFARTSKPLSKLGGFTVSPKDCQRVAEKKGENIISENDAGIAAFESGESQPEDFGPIETMYFEVDGTGVALLGNELIGVKGRQDDGAAKTKEAKIGCIFTQTTVDEDGNPVRDPDSTTYCGKLGSIEEFTPLFMSEAKRRGYEKARRTVFLADGAKWCWRLAENFPGCIQILDLYHAKEHVSKLVDAVIQDPVVVSVKKNKLFKILENGQIDKLVKEFKTLGAETQAEIKMVQTESNYFLLNKERTRYRKFKEQGLFVGSGVIESACKNVVGKRLKQPGMRWSGGGADEMIALRCNILSQACYSAMSADSDLPLAA
jgi:hypothetical protein